MTDTSTFMCYIKGKDNAKLPNFPDDVPWNSKKWRMLCFLSNDNSMLFAGRQYPFEISSVLELVAKIVNVLFRSSFHRWYHDKIRDDETTGICLNSPYIAVGHDLLPMNILVKDAEGSMHYNDLLYSSCYSPYYSYNLNYWGNHYRFLKCGRDTFYYWAKGKMS